MNMNIWQNIIMGFVAGFAELLPVSGEAHRALVRCMMGIKQEDAVFALIIHIACLVALLHCCREDVKKLSRTRKLMKVPPKRRKHQPDGNTVLLMKLLQVAMVPMVIGKLFTGMFDFVGNELQILAFSVLANGVLLLVPSLVRNGNKDQRNMPRLDGMMMGSGAALSAIPGFSMLGCTLAAGISRGVDRKFALRYAYLLMIPGMGIRILFDLLAVFTGGAALFSPMGMLAALIGGVLCYLGAIAASRIMQFLSFSSNFSAFSYYCFGVGLFSFVLFLTV